MHSDYLRKEALAARDLRHFQTDVGKAVEEVSKEASHAIQIASKVCADKEFLTFLNSPAGQDITKSAASTLNLVTSLVGSEDGKVLLKAGAESLSAYSETGLFSLRSRNHRFTYPSNSDQPAPNLS